MKTILLYMQDDYMRQFQARVISTLPGNLILDQTAFYPTGGHQACDLGKISKGTGNLAYVTGVRKIGSVVHHEIELVSGDFAEGDKVEGIVDWERRYYHMQLHTAQHIFSKCFLNRFGATTWRSDLSIDGGLVVMDKPVTCSEVTVIESETNEVISHSLPVRRVMCGERAHIQIGEFSMDECGGTHVRNTSEIFLFKVYKISEKNIYYQVGERALEMALDMANASLEIAETLEVDDVLRIPGKVGKIVGEMADQQEVMDESRDRLTQLQVQRALETSQHFGAIEVLLLDLGHLHSKTAKQKVLQLQDEGRVILCTAGNNSIIVCSKDSSTSAKKVLKSLSAQWHLRGGGSDFYAQGGPYPDEVTDPFDEILQIIKTKENKLCLTENPSESHAAPN
jgi:alanyl-tRNA synthetase